MVVTSLLKSSCVSGSWSKLSILRRNVHPVSQLSGNMQRGSAVSTPVVARARNENSDEAKNMALRSSFEKQGPLHAMSLMKAGRYTTNPE